MSYFGNLIDRLGDRVKDLDVTADPGKSIAKRRINADAKWVYSCHPWEWRFKTGQTTLIPNYTTGTCAVTSFDGTNEGTARTVTFSGSVLSTAMQGRYFKPDGEDDWHKINYVDVTNNQIILETPILRTTSSGLTFDIWKRFYNLPGEVAQITDFGRWNSLRGRLEYKSFSNLIDSVHDVSAENTPDTFSPFGVDQFEPSYSTGTITGAQDSNLLTVSGGTPLGNILSGDLIVKDEDTIFSVKRVESNTRIILNNYLPDAVAAGTPLTSRRNLSVGFQFYPSKTDDYMTIPFYYYDRMFDMVHEELDRPNLPDDFDEAILTRSEFKLKQSKGLADWVGIASLFSAELESLKSDFRVATPRYDVFAPEVRGYPGR